MGLAASQARALLLVARKSDLEYRAQCISQRKMVLAQQTETLARNYSDAISNRNLQFVYYLNGSQPVYENLSYSSLSASNPNFVGEYRVIDAKGQIVVASASEIPNTKVTVPVYGEIEKKADGSMGFKEVDKTEHVETTLTVDDSSDKTPLFMLGQDQNGNEAWIQVKNSDGTPKGNAVTYTKASDGTYVAVNIFNATDSGSKDSDGNAIINYTMKDQFKSSQLYEEVTSKSYVESYSKPSGTEYGIVRYETKEVAPTPASDGSYYYSDPVTGQKRKYVICPDIAKDAYFQNGLRNGAFYLQQAQSKTTSNDDGSTSTYTSWETKPWQGISSVSDRLNSEDDAIAESTYEAETAVISAQDKRLDMELKQIETQHKAVETEEASVKKIIESNIDKTFKIFAQS